MNKQSRLLEEGLAMYRGVSEKIAKSLEQAEKTGSFEYKSNHPQRPCTPPLPLDATSVLDILAQRDHALYNHVMQIAAEYCRDGAMVVLHGRSGERGVTPSA